MEYNYSHAMMVVRCLTCILQMSYVSSSPALSDRSRFLSFWRTFPSDDSVTAAVLAVVKEYGWKQLKIITQEETLFTEVSNSTIISTLKNSYAFLKLVLYTTCRLSMTIIVYTYIV